MAAEGGEYGLVRLKEWKAERGQIKKQEGGGWTMTVKQEKDEHKPVWVSGAATMPEGSEFSQLLLFLSLTFIKWRWLDFMGSQDYSGWKGPHEII